MKNVGKILIILGVVFGLLGIRSVWREYKFQQVVTTVKAKVVFAEIKDIRTKYGNYYLKPTHQINQQLAFLRDGSMDTISLQSNFLLYTEGKTIKNPNPIPTVEQLMKEVKYVRYIPESKKKETTFPDRIDINNDDKYEAEHRLSYFSDMMFCFVFGGILHLFFRTKKSSNHSSR